jgi:transcriptional regulator with XRE-family HTH domain
MSDEKITCPRCGGCGYLTPATATVGDLIREKRIAASLTQEQLAMKVRISRAQIANIEAGRTDPQLKSLRSYADALGCQMKDLIP